ncbi:MAG: hypothetical protein GDA41_12465 [Rhodospirillales bacterium]|nr:hypothetical protein [Rhodospirillales bacterium]
MAAHSAIANLKKMPAGILSALREGRPLDDRKVRALRAFAGAMTVTRGRPDEIALQALLQAD